MLGDNYRILYIFFSPGNLDSNLTVCLFGMKFKKVTLPLSASSSLSDLRILLFYMSLSTNLLLYFMGIKYCKSNKTLLS